MEVGDIFQNSNTQNMFAQLGTFVDNEYILSDDCYSKYYCFNYLNIYGINDDNIY